MPERPDLHLDVYVAPMRPMRGAPAQGPGDDPMWSPMSSALIHGEHDAVLVDTLVTFDDVRLNFGEEIANLVDGVTKLSQLELFSERTKQAEGRVTGGGDLGWSRGAAARR